MTDWRAYCVAGIWQSHLGIDGRPLIGMAMLTLNADEHPLLRLMHQPWDEKRGVVILGPSDYDEWLYKKSKPRGHAPSFIWHTKC